MQLKFNILDIHYYVPTLVGAVVSFFWTEPESGSVGIFIRCVELCWLAPQQIHGNTTEETKRKNESLNTGGLRIVMLLVFLLAQAVHGVSFGGRLLLLKCELLIHVGHHPGIDGGEGSPARLAGGHLGHDGIELSGVDQGGHLAVVSGGLVAALEEAALGGEALLASGLPLGILLLLGGLLGGVEGGDGGALGAGGGPGGLLLLPPVDLAEGHLALLEGRLVGHLVPQVGLLAAFLPHEAAGDGRYGLALGGGNAGPSADALEDLPGDLVLGGIAVGPGVVVLARDDEAAEGGVAGVVQNTVASAQENIGCRQRNNQSQDTEQRQRLGTKQR